MSKLRMKKIELIAMLTDSKKIIELLQRRGVVEICSNTDDELMDTNVTAAVGVFEKFLDCNGWYPSDTDVNSSTCSIRICTI